jgi:hypothetical protein
VGEASGIAVFEQERKENVIEIEELAQFAIAFFAACGINANIRGKF